MSPYLTTRGRWLLLSAGVFLLLGAILSEPILLYLGQVQIVLLGIAFMLLVPGALALDRRKVRFEVLEDDDETSRKSAHVVGDHVTRRVRVTNESGITLHALHADPFGADALEGSPAKARRFLPGHSSLETAFEVDFKRTGRWMLHGFDVRIADPLGLLETRDYLPAPHPFEVYPKRGALRRRLTPRAGGISRREGGRHPVEQLGLGTDVRELREHQSGDPLRHIAWKATVRRGKLISKNFEHETAMSVYLMLDVSCSMRGGQTPGQKLEYGITTAVSIAEALLKRRDSVGLMTFDEKLYGHVAPSSAPHHARRILHHLVGVSSIVDPDLTEYDEDEVGALVADYLLIQERLDFRKGDEVDEVTGVNRKLLQRWLMSVFGRTKEEYGSAVLTQGIFEQRASRLRQFAQLRGLEIPYRVEARLGMKERGLVEALEQLVTQSSGKHMIVVISDLCGIMNLDMLTRGIRLALVRGHRIKFIVPFTPAFYGEGKDLSPKYDVLKGLFTSAERQERMRIVTELRSLGVAVEFSQPH